MPVADLHVFYIAGNQYQTESKRSETFWRFFWTRRQKMGQGSTRGVSRRGHNPPGRAWGSRRAPGGCAHCGDPHTSSLLYKYPKIPETLGDSTKNNSSRRKFQNHEIQSRALFWHLARGNTITEGFIISLVLLR